MQRVRTPLGFNVTVVYACVAIALGVLLRVLPVEESFAAVLHVYIAPGIVVLAAIGLYFGAARGSFHESKRARDYGMRGRAVIAAVIPTGWRTEDHEETVVGIDLEVREAAEPFRVRIYRDLPRRIADLARPGRTVAVAYMPERRGELAIDWDSLAS
jgi:hypothetical protein